jgi:coproporphyrinogen III oxidase
MDVTPSNNFENEAIGFHRKLKEECDKHNPNYYNEHKKWCDEYFFLKHRNEPRGIGGIFFDYLNTEDHEKDFNYVKKIGGFFHNYADYILKKYKNTEWTDEHRKKQLIKRSRYVEFNILYDRGTKFGLETGGNVEAILMSMPPLASWE